MDKKLLIVIFVLLVAIIGITIVGLKSDNEPTDILTEESTLYSQVTETTLSLSENHFQSVDEGYETEEMILPLKEFTTADISYLDNALFIGDSRTVGLQNYSDITNADFYSSVGMNVFKIKNETVTVDGVSTDLASLLSNKQYGKVYIMLGINELGYNRQSAFSKYKELIDTILLYQPSAVIFIQANIHVGAERSAKDSIINNKAINEFNSMIASLENKSNIFYIDVNSVYDDENGNLNSEATSDGIHLYASQFNLWKEFILTKAVI